MPRLKRIQTDTGKLTSWKVELKGNVDPWEVMAVLRKKVERNGLKLGWFDIVSGERRRSLVFPS